MATEKVHLYIYDLSQGLAAKMSPMLIGKLIEGVWHTSIVVFNREYFFGSHGVESCNPGATAIGKPLKIEELGETQIPYPIFIEYLNGLSESTYSGPTYDLFHHNCNNFSNELAQFLCGTTIPKHILDLPNEVLNSSLNSVVVKLLQQLEYSARPIAEEQSKNHKETSPEFEQLNTQIEEARCEMNGDAKPKKE